MRKRTEGDASRRSIVRAVYAALGALASLPAAAQIAAVPVKDVDPQRLFEALALECYEAGLAADVPRDSTMDCSGILEERTADSGDPNASVVIRHKLRFNLLDRANEPQIAADAWTETEELGTVIETPITTEDYAARVRDVLERTVRRLRAPPPAAPAWAARYESEQAFDLDAHLRAVRRCDRELAKLHADELGAQLESVGLRPMSADTRDRCEQLYERVYEWGLARGAEEPTVDDLVRYRSALPPEQRACSGRLALDETPCR